MTNFSNFNYQGMTFQLDLYQDFDIIELCDVEVIYYSPEILGSWDEPMEHEEFQFKVVCPNSSERFVSVSEDCFDEYENLVNEAKYLVSFCLDEDIE